MELDRYKTDQLAEIRGQVRMNIVQLERKGACRSVAECQTLTEQRSLLNRITRELKRRVVQLPLF